MKSPSQTEQDAERDATGPPRSTPTTGVETRPERLQKVERLLHAVDYKRALRFGRCFRHEVMRVHGLETRRELSRMGLVVSRKVGKATVRNTVKRRLREVFRRSKASFGRLRRPIDVVFIPNPSYGPATLAEYRQVLELFVKWWQNRPPARNRGSSRRPGKTGERRNRQGSRQTAGDRKKAAAQGRGGAGDDKRKGKRRGSGAGKREGTKKKT